MDVNFHKVPGSSSSGLEEHKCCEYTGRGWIYAPCFLALGVSGLLFVENLLRSLMANQSWVTEYYLQGFSGLPGQYNAITAFIFFLVYMMSLCVNSTVIYLIAMKENLHQPMYILMGFLSLSDLTSDTATLPKVIARYWFDSGSIAFSACFLQMFVFHFLNILDSMIILLMSFDRYIAICKPLQYRAIITPKVLFILCFIAILFAASIGLYCIIHGLLLSYCGPNRIKNLFCAVVYVAVLSCKDTYATRQNLFYVTFNIHLIALVLIVLSYVIIISKLSKTGQSVTWKKAVYTCSSHWFVIALYFIPRLVVYGYNQNQLIPNVDLNILLVCLYTYVPHFSSPVIFCFTTKEVKRVMKKVFKNYICVNKRKS
ncbi:olfactory receptor 52E8-like [Hyperolius riggenbachi]|uniref:olfactory receptor 52E8-like n=1 Tax=Hyperolius riggenbachi TaxID=752182 RepID=UPI0035A3D2B9